MNDSSATTIFIVLNYFVIVGIALIAKLSLEMFLSRNTSISDFLWALFCVHKKSEMEILLYHCPQLIR